MPARRGQPVTGRRRLRGRDPEPRRAPQRSPCGRVGGRSRRGRRPSVPVRSPRSPVTSATSLGPHPIWRTRTTPVRTVPPAAGSRATRTARPPAASPRRSTAALPRPTTAPASRSGPGAAAPGRERSASVPGRSGEYVADQRLQHRAAAARPRAAAAVGRGTASGRRPGPQRPSSASVVRPVQRDCPTARPAPAHRGRCATHGSRPQRGLPTADADRAVAGPEARSAAEVGQGLPRLLQPRLAGQQRLLGVADRRSSPGRGPRPAACRPAIACSSWSTAPCGPGPRLGVAPRPPLLLGVPDRLLDRCAAGPRSGPGRRAAPCRRPPSGPGCRAAPPGRRCGSLTGSSASASASSASLTARLARNSASVWSFAAVPGGEERVLRGAEPRPQRVVVLAGGAPAAFHRSSGRGTPRRSPPSRSSVDSSSASATSFSLVGAASAALLVERAEVLAALAVERWSGRG